MRCWAEIGGAALRHNLKVIRRELPRGVQVMGIVKANAYGHGVIPVARELVRQGVKILCVANVAEARELRDAKLREPILLLSACLPEEMEEAIRCGAMPTLSTWDEARLLDRAARKLKVRAKAHFKIDTGMGRLGAWHEEAARLLERIAQLPGVEVTGVYTHFASADVDDKLTRTQLQRFAALWAEFGDRLIHAANSPALFRYPESVFDAVRPGIMLYGLSVVDGWQPKLRPVLEWKSRVTLVHSLPRGRTVSYGATYRLPQEQRLATVAVGYADGYPRLLSNRGSVLVKGQRCPIRGRVTMDQIIVDVSKARGVTVGTEVVLIGKQGREQILASDLASMTGTISYEILTGISSRVPRVFKGNGKQ